MELPYEIILYISDVSTIYMSTVLSRTCKSYYTAIQDTIVDRLKKSYATFLLNGNPGYIIKYLQSDKSVTLSGERFETIPKKIFTKCRNDEFVTLAELLILAKIQLTIDDLTFLLTKERTDPLRILDSIEYSGVDYPGVLSIFTYGNGKGWKRLLLLNCLRHRKNYFYQNIDELFLLMSEMGDDLDKYLKILKINIRYSDMHPVELLRHYLPSNNLVINELLDIIEAGNNISIEYWLINYETFDIQYTIRLESWRQMMVTTKILEIYGPMAAVKFGRNNMVTLWKNCGILINVEFHKIMKFIRTASTVYYDCKIVEDYVLLTGIVPADLLMQLNLQEMLQQTALLDKLNILNRLQEMIMKYI